MATTQAKNKFQLKKEATNAGLLDAAMRCFHDRGYGATTIDDIVAVVGQTKGAFYFHFDNKEDCFLQVVAYRESLRGDLGAIPKQHDRASSSLADVLMSLMTAFAEQYDDQRAWVLVMVDFWFHASRPSEVANLFAEIYAGWITEIASFLEALAAGGWIEANQDTRALASQLFAFGEGMTVHAQLYGIDPEPLLIPGFVAILRAETATE